MRNNGVSGILRKYVSIEVLTTGVRTEPSKRSSYSEVATVSQASLSSGVPLNIGTVTFELCHVYTFQFSTSASHLLKILQGWAVRCSGLDVERCAGCCYQSLL
jgi:hypothetical protein